MCRGTKRITLEIKINDAPPSITQVIEGGAMKNKQGKIAFLFFVL